MISAFKEQASVKKGGIIEICCPDLQPNTIVDVIILIRSSPNDKEKDKEKEIFETKKYPVSDFSVLLKDGPKISLKQKKITREWIHRTEKENDLYR